MIRTIYKILEEFTEDEVSMVLEECWRIEECKE